MHDPYVSGGPAADSPEALAAYADRLQAKNHALAAALRRATDELAKAKSQLEQFTRPPLGFATMLRLHECASDDHGVRHASVEVMHGARRMIVPVAAQVDAARLEPGMTLLLDENLVVVATAAAETVGAVRAVDDVLDDGRVIIVDASGDRRLVRRAHDLRDARLTCADRVVVDPSNRFAVAMVPREDTAQLLLEEAPDVSFADIGGLDAQIARIRDAVQLPFEHRDLYAAYGLTPPKGVLLYGPPGNGKTLIAKAIAHELAGDGARGVFLAVKGPELLNKYVGESERLIRLLFDRARERAASGQAVIVFIDEMDALLRTRGSGVSSDVETTIVPQFLAELDGVERLDNVIVIGASNRVDMIDPAVLRPGRLDVKIRVDRPDRDAALAITARYLTPRLPYADGVDAAALARTLVDDVYRRDGARRLGRAVLDDGSSRPLDLADVVSGAMLRNIVDRAKTAAVKASVGSGETVALDAAMIVAAVDDEHRSVRDTLGGIDAVQWAKVNALGDGHVVELRRDDDVVDNDGTNNDDDINNDNVSNNDGGAGDGSDRGRGRA
ncbi:ATPase AAA [Bifidobacterium anseris]|uniref:ATPase AAA n=1 Tax=Bifidobacterium anseris TaxID=2020963 RepID=A0A2N5J2N3_9BIFI|nr:proteasome ATPase [Bifidobacterium anseris]PLS28480.1 ATPase AAA [Bifidobacterium anseris]